MQFEKDKLYELLNWYYQMGVDEVVKEDLKEEISIIKPKKASIMDKTIPANNTNVMPIEKKILPKNTAFDLRSPIKAANDAKILADKATNLEELKISIQNFDGCMLKKTATNTVFADGVANAKIMLIGEAPGANEDAKAIPFCGESGKLLDIMLKTINLSRNENIYITNTVFWRPPGNRPPTEAEIEICRPFVQKHIALIEPKLIVLIGSTAATSLIGNHVQITKIRKEYYSYTNSYLNSAIPVTALFHPAYLLRQPLQKKTMWYDLLHLQDYITANNLL